MVVPRTSIWRHDERAQLGVFRIVQEALTNIARHAGATEASVELQLSKNDSDAGNSCLELVIHDNGRGFALSEMSTGLGLRGIRERANAMAAEVHIESAPAKGVRITLRVPGEVRQADRINFDQAQPQVVRMIANE